MRSASSWKAIFKSTSPILSRRSPAQHRSISLNSGIQQGILAENSRRLPKGRPKHGRDGLDSLLNSVHGSTSRHKPSRRGSDNYKPTAERFSRARERSPQGKVTTKPYQDTERWKPRRGAAFDGRASSAGPRRKIIADLDDLDDLDELKGFDGPRGASDGSRWPKTSSRSRKHPAPSPRRRPSQYAFDDDPVRSATPSFRGRASSSSAAERSFPPREQRNSSTGRRFEGRRPWQHTSEDPIQSASSSFPRRTSSSAAERPFPSRERRNATTGRKFVIGRRPSQYATDDDPVQSARPSFRDRTPSSAGAAEEQPFPLRERRKIAIGNKFEAETQRKDEQEARVRGAFGAVPDDIDELPPKRLPLASAASELVYGRNAIVAALRGARRKAYKLWVCQRAFVDKERNWHDCRREAAEIEQLVKDTGAEVAFVSRHWLPLMDAVAGYRQHNGLILDASPIPVPQITNLLPWSSDSNGLYYEVARANVSEDVSRQARVRYGLKGASRRPIVVLLCNVTDTGNLGAICRSAYWYDIDGVVIPKRASAGPSAPAAKASSGGIEGVNILCVDDVKGFIKQSQRAGWHVMAAMPPPSAEAATKSTASALEFDVSKPDSGLARLDEEKAVLLLLGGEDAGVPEKYAELANSYITMSRSKPDALGVDSLNVSVAAALIFSEFARTQPARQSTAELDDPENILF